MSFCTGRFFASQPVFRIQRSSTTSLDGQYRPPRGHREGHQPLKSVKSGLARSNLPLAVKLDAMGRRPNPVISEFFERGPKLNDNSNR